VVPDRRGRTDGKDLIWRSVTRPAIPLDAALGLAFAHTGVLYPFFGTLLGCIGVALTKFSIPHRFLLQRTAGPYMWVTNGSAPSKPSLSHVFQKADGTAAVHKGS
jgi:hypothetical protein